MSEIKMDSGRSCMKCIKRKVCFVQLSIFDFVNRNLDFFSDTNVIPVGIANACKEFEVRQKCQSET